MSTIRIVTDGITRGELLTIAAGQFGDFVKAVVDLERRVMAVGGELHADEEQVLLDQASRQQNLWGINLYPQAERDAFLEFDSMINVRPSQGNRSRSVEDPATQQRIRELVESLVRP